MRSTPRWCKSSIAAIDAFEADANIGCILITGSDKAFAAGADIKEMANKTYAGRQHAATSPATRIAIARARKPVVAAVAGFALGGGCEFAMQCDIIIAADNAKFGQPEIKLGVIPGYRRHAAADARGRQGQGDGPDPDRPHDGRGRGRARRAWWRAWCRRRA